MALVLTARMNGTRVDIDGDKGRVRLPPKAPARTFQFHVNDTTGLNVRFNALAVHESEDCPNEGVFATDQIVDVAIGGQNASFRDLNSNGPRVLAYSWLFSCDDPEQRPDFDPVIENGGGNN